MDKRKLRPGHSYNHRRKEIIEGRELEAERWIRFEKSVMGGAWFSRYFEAPIYLTDRQIKEELSEESGRTDGTV